MPGWKAGKHGLISLVLLANVIFIIYVISNAYRTPNNFSTLTNDGSYNTRNITKIVIFTYMRSGSTFFSELFSQHPDVFYIFEPLRICGCLKHDFDYPKDKTTIQNAYIKYILNCDFGNNDFLSRVKNNKKCKWKSTFRGVDDVESVPHLCASKKIVAIKIIRAESLERVAGVLGSDTALFFLIRDPRGVLNSRKQLPSQNMYMHMADKLRDMNDLCKMDLANYEFLQRLSRESASQLHKMPLIKLIQYEHIAYDPLSIAKKLYEFINIPFHNRVADWINNNTFSGSDQILHGTKRKSKEIPNKWRTGLTKEEIHMVHSIKACAKVVELFGYNNT
ncbi:unnamed protein product [Owenia fusiformis]|uniref:Uncharacterized protein n=1 Tax=Owenia fusiformis TaxID=6347 RepID=A0A8J1Y0L5_OWEFU|nr:unnamed protein product [Owenia fusiformis]